jgi:hypothetical protein
VFFLDVFLPGASHLVLVNVCLGKMRSGLSPEPHVGRDGDEEWSISALKDRSSVDLASVDYYRTNYPPCTRRGCGVRLVVDSTVPVAGSV